MDASAPTQARPGIGTSFVPPTHQRGHPSYDALWSPMLGIRFALWHEIVGVGVSARMCRADGVKTWEHYVCAGVTGSGRD